LNRILAFSGLRALSVMTMSAGTWTEQPKTILRRRFIN
jgi:hypothetical protein